MRQHDILKALIRVLIGRVSHLDIGAFQQAHKDVLGSANSRASILVGPDSQPLR